MKPRPLVPILLTLLVAPVTAEYLIGYDDIIGQPGALVFGIVFFAPLYGAPAVLIREMARQRGLGWPSILLMATAVGLVQAGLIDQSLFDPDYRDIPYWSLMREPTLLPWFGTSAYMIVTFVAGHVLGSLAAPIALAESWTTRPTRPWMRRRGLVGMAVLWLAGAAFILGDQLSTSTSRISWGQGLSTAAIAVLLVLAALRLPAPRTDRSGPVPAPWVVLVVTASLLTVRSVVPTGWPSTLAAVLTIGAALLLLGRWSGRLAWTGTHLVAAVTGDLLSIGGPAFFTEPLGDVALVPKLITNAVLLALVLAIAGRGLVVQRRAQR